MANDIYAQTQAFAAICQAGALIQDLANCGTWDEDAAAILIKSLATDSTNDLEQLYPPRYLKKGYFSLVQCFSGNTGEQRYLQLAKYVILFVRLERKVTKSATAAERLARRLSDNTAEARSRHLSVLDPDLIANLSNIYKSEISDTGLLKFNIYGKKNMLQQLHIQHKIRALILAAIKAVILWRSAGGRRRSFIFKRSRLVECANTRLKQI